MRLLKHHAFFFLSDWAPTLQNLAAASLRKKPRRKPNLAAESVSLSENVGSSGRRSLNDKQREGGCLMIESVIMSPPFFYLPFHILSLCVCLPHCLGIAQHSASVSEGWCVGEEARVFVVSVCLCAALYIMAWLLRGKLRRGMPGGWRKVRMCVC